MKDYLQKKTPCQSHLIILIDPVYRSDQSYYCQGLLEDHEDKIKEKRVKNLTTEDLIDSDSVWDSENDNTYEDELGIDKTFFVKLQKAINVCVLSMNVILGTLQVHVALFTVNF